MGYLSAKKKCWDIIKKYYPEYEGKQPVIESAIRPYLKNNFVLLDIGCGRGKETAIQYRGEVRKSLGIDISEMIKFNNTVHHCLRADACSIPFADNSIDMVVSQELIEHLEKPALLVKEVSRILKHEGIFVLSTPNLLSWKTAVSYLTPYSFHKKMNRELYGVEDADVFPTYYRMNTASRIDRLMKMNGMSKDRIILWEGTPRTLTFNVLTTYLDIFITRVLRRFSLFKNYRELIIVCYKKR